MSNNLYGIPDIQVVKAGYGKRRFIRWNIKVDGKVSESQYKTKKAAEVRVSVIRSKLMKRCNNE